MGLGDVWLVLGKSIYPIVVVGVGADCRLLTGGFAELFLDVEKSMTGVRCAWNMVNSLERSSSCTASKVSNVQIELVIGSLPCP